LTVYLQSSNRWRIVVKIHNRWVRRIVTGTKRDAERLVEALLAETKTSAEVQRVAPSFCDAFPYETEGVH
jgi:hypothetical protein